MATMKRMGSDPLDMTTQDKVVTVIIMSFLVAGDQIFLFWLGRAQYWMGN